jgi:hypothetical protein
MHVANATPAWNFEFGADDPGLTAVLLGDDEPQPASSAPAQSMSEMDMFRMPQVLRRGGLQGGNGPCNRPVTRAWPSSAGLQELLSG